MMKSRSKGRRVRWATLGSAMALGLVACGGGETAAPTERPEPQAPAAQAPAEPAEPVIDFSGRTVSVFIRSSPGGGYDTWGRQVAAFIGDHLPGNPTVVVENVPGAGGNVMLGRLYTANPDGTVFGISNIVSVALDTVLQKLDFDVRELTSLARVADDQKGVFLNPNGRYSSFEELRNAQEPVLVALTGLSGGAGITAITLFETLGIPWQPVTHNGSSEAVLSTVRGDTDVNINDLRSSAVAGFVESGELVPVLFTGQTRDPAYPDVPAASEFGLNDSFSKTSPEARAFFGPPGMDPAVVAVIDQAMRDTVADPRFVEWMESAGVTPDFLGAEESIAALLETSASLARFSEVFIGFLG